MIEEVRAGFAALNHKFRATPEDGTSSENRESNSVSVGNKSTSPMPIFGGSEPLAWLARANQYFLVNKTSSDRRVDVAMLAIDGPAKPWKQLLVRRCPSLSWDKLVQELLQRFGDTITSGSCVAGNSSKYSSKDPFSTVSVAKNQPKIPPRTSNNSAAILPIVTAPLLSSSLSTTALPEIPPITTSTIHPDIDTKADNRTPLPLVVQQPIHISVLVPLPSPTNLPTPTVVTTPLWFSSADISLFQHFFPLLLCTVHAAAAELATIMYLLLLVHGHIPWFSFSPPVQKHEWEPPPNNVIGFSFELSLEGKAVLKVRQLIRIGGGERKMVGPAERKEEAGEEPSAMWNQPQMIIPPIVKVEPDLPYETGQLDTTNPISICPFSTQIESQPYLEVSVKIVLAHTRRWRLRLTKSQKMKAPMIIYLRGSVGGLWPVVYREYVGGGALTANWTEFCKRNSIKPRDNCRFQAEENISFVVFRVIVTHGSD
ncbi:uncharacterized protein LOC121807818 isoform X4 [Salvia splendens]|uniref:uncharacterized protein LOC121807818 isoform X4 n=1 Tax=Salvia splendens TaxID=180675 RepID=UPI001C256C0B|nr:uncharacterized protein LOC121807818 isoform X4 [Salvia splendens]